MVAPVKTKEKKAGATLEIRSVFGESTLTSSFATAPMKLLAPRSRGRSVWAYTSSFGGGLVAGDQTELEITLGAGSRCFISTQASTKVYRNPANLPCGHSTEASVAEKALLVFAPDPVQAFAASSYVQRQQFHLVDTANLVLLDWFSSGRAARGERWLFANYQSRNDIFVAGERVVVDAIRLNPNHQALDSRHCTGRFNCFATLLFIGPGLSEHAKRSLEDVSSRPVERNTVLLTSVSPVPNGIFLRVAGENVEQVGRELHRHLGPLAVLLGDDPWERKW